MKNIKLLAFVLSMTCMLSSAFALARENGAPRSKRAPQNLPWVLPASANDSCQKNCSIDADCGQGGFCDVGFCSHRVAYCLNDRWSVNARGETWNCNAYRCNSENGLCFRSATSNDFCTSGYVFDGKNACMPSVSCAANDAACQDLYSRWLKARQDYEKQTPQPNPAPFSCIACTNHEDCGANQMCWKGRCELSDSFCAVNGDGDEVVANKQGVIANCRNFACDPIVKSCFTHCQTTQDCRNGKTCSNGMCL